MTKALKLRSWSCCLTKEALDEGLEEPWREEESVLHPLLSLPPGQGGRLPPRPEVQGPLRGNIEEDQSEIRRYLKNQTLLLL